MHTHDNATFPEWFSIIQGKVKDAGFDFFDEDSVAAEYLSGESAESVAQDIIKEYKL